MPTRNHHIFLSESQHHIIDSANPRSALDYSVEYRLHVRRRAADDAKHLGRCGLMLQGFTQFCIALLDLLEQPDVFDGDDRLVRKGLQKRDLFLGEWTYFFTANRN